MQQTRLGWTAAAHVWSRSAGNLLQHQTLHIMLAVAWWGWGTEAGPAGWIIHLHESRTLCCETNIQQHQRVWTPPHSVLPHPQPFNPRGSSPLPPQRNFNPASPQPCFLQTGRGALPGQGRLQSRERAWFSVACVQKLCTASNLIKIRHQTSRLLQA